VDGVAAEGFIFQQLARNVLTARREGELFKTESFGRAIEGLTIEKARHVINMKLEAIDRKRNIYATA